MGSEVKYPIREVSKITGVNPVTLRAWQRRYGLIVPERTDKGHRLYSLNDIQDIKQILVWLEQGVSIGQVKGLLKSTSADSGKSNNWVDAIEELLEGVNELNFGKLETKVQEYAKLYPSHLLREKIIRPLEFKLAAQERPDKPLLVSAFENTLALLFQRIVTIQTGPMVGVASVGGVSLLHVMLTQYELQGLEARSRFIGDLEPKQIALSKSRFSPKAWIMLLGHGLTESFFKENKKHWPDNCFFVGDASIVYGQAGWFALPYSSSVTELVKAHEASFGLV